MTNINYENVHKVTNDDGSYYFRQFRKCSDGRFVCGIDYNESEAIRKAEIEYQKIEVHLSLSPRDRLKNILSSTKSGSLCSTPMEECIRLIAEIILEVKECQ